MSRRRLVAFSIATAIIGGWMGAAWADLSVKDATSTTRTIYNFVCQSTKLCNATVLIKSDGTEIGTSTNPVRTDPTGTTAQPVSASSLPLPTGAATQTTLAAIAAQLPAALGGGGGLKVDGSGTALPVSAQAAITGGASTTGNIAANNTTAVVVKASAGTLYGAQIYGIGSAPAYLKIYNATSATCGSGTPVKRLMIPANSTAALGAGSNVSFGDVGVAFSTGITYCVTTGIADNDTTAPAASTFLVNLDWK